MSDEYGRPGGDESEGALRDRPPDVLQPIDPTAPVSGHAAPPTGPSPTEAPEHDWDTARPTLFPVLRPAGTTGQPAEVALDPTTAGAQAHTQPLVSAGPCGLVIAFVLTGPGFDVLVNGEHLLSWGVDAGALADAAGANLAAWSGAASWTDEISGTRRLLSSSTGEGHDAARILLPEVRETITRELLAGAPTGTRVLVGLPDRDLLMAGALVPGDEEFGALFRDFVVEHSGDAQEPIDRRVFELVGGELVEFAP